MTKTTTRYSISAAHRITGRSRTTIQRHVKAGKLSCTEDDGGNKLIDASELIRVYGDDCDFTSEEAAPKREEGANPVVQHELNTLQQQVKSLEEERRRERDQLQAQVEHLKDALKLAQEGHNKATLLLENRSGGGEWRQAIDALEAKFADREKAFRDEATEAEQAARDDFWGRPWWRLLAK